MGFYQMIRTSYGIEALTVLKEWAKTNIRLARLRNRRVFLLNCKKFDTSPNHIKDHVKGLFNIMDTSNSNTIGEVDRFNSRLGHKILSLEIKITVKLIIKSEKILNQLKTRAFSLIPHYMVREFEFHITHDYNRVFNKIKQCNIRKLNNMKINLLRNVCGRPQWIHNRTNVNIPEEVNTILSLGPKFSIPPTVKDIPMKRLLANVESIIELGEEDSKNIMRAKVTNIITNYVQEKRHDCSYIRQMFQKSRKFLKENPQLIVTTSDKGNVTVIMHREEYNNKLMELINDTEVYSELPSNPTNKYQTKNNKLIGELKKKKFITDQQAKQLTTYNAVPPRMYGLPKVHKENCPLRPIVSTIKSPTSKISKFCASILKAAFDDYFEFAIKDSFTFASRVNNFQLPDGYVVVSLDVVSLFTNISLDLTITIIEEEWDRCKLHTNIPREEFIDIIRFLFQSNYFTYQGKFYSQIFGCPMGSNLSPILANIVMSNLIKTSINKLTFSIPFLYQYMDDLILAVPHTGKEEILQIFNDYNQHIKFTIEEENQSSVPFLDTRVIRTTDNVIKLDWYQKSIHSGRYINYSSYHGIKMKTNVILGLRRRIENITHPDFCLDAKKRLERILLQNGYPRSFLRKLLFDQINVNRPTENPNPVVMPQDVEGPVVRFSSLPFIDTLTNRLTNVFKHIKNLKIAQYNLITNHINFTNLKDKIPIANQSDVVYKIPCSQCEAIYIGQTSQALSRRITLHKSDSRLRPDRCALANHAYNKKHVIDFESVRILEHETNNFNRTFLEMCHINNHENTMNSKADINKLNIFYKYLLFLENNRYSTVNDCHSSFQ